MEITTDTVNHTSESSKATIDAIGVRLVINAPLPPVGMGLVVYTPERPKIVDTSPDQLPDVDSVITIPGSEVSELNGIFLGYARL